MISDVLNRPDAQRSQLFSDENYPQTVDEVHISNDLSNPITGLSTTLRMCMLEFESWHYAFIPVYMFN